MRNPFNFTIGADPEFSLLFQDRRIQANAAIDEILKKDADFKKKANMMGYELEGKGNIGWDSASATGEIRPRPASTADELIENLRAIFAKFHEKAPLFDITTLSLFGTVGGHIHFSVPEEFQTDAKIGNIHKKLSSFYLPIMLSECKINLHLRLKSGYGKLTDWRSANYTPAGNVNDGGDRPNGYEFRSPSAEWLTTPKVALGTIAYLATVYNEIVNHPVKIARFSELLYHTSKQADVLQLMALSDYKILTTAIYSKVKKAIKTFEFYPEYKAEIDYILNPEKVYRDKANAGFNIVSGWELTRKEKKPTKKDLLNVKKMSTQAKAKNIDMTNSFINVSFNNDANVELFSKALVERVAVYDWKLKNAYFLYGLRKGFISFLVNDPEKNLYLGKELIKTQSDYQAIKELAAKMSSKYTQNMPYGRNSNLKQLIDELNPNRKTQTFIIGIPYDTRMDHSINPFISLIYDLEAGKIKPEMSLAKAGKELPDDNALPDKERGMTWRLMNEINIQSGQNLPFTVDDLRTAARRAEEGRLTMQDWGALQEPARNNNPTLVSQIGIINDSNFNEDD